MKPHCNGHRGRKSRSQDDDALLPASTPHEFATTSLSGAIVVLTKKFHKVGELLN